MPRLNSRIRVFLVLLLLLPLFTQINCKGQDLINSFNRWSSPGDPITSCKAPPAAYRFQIINIREWETSSDGTKERCSATATIQAIQNSDLLFSHYRESKHRDGERSGWRSSWMPIAVGEEVEVFLISAMNNLRTGESEYERLQYIIVFYDRPECRTYMANELIEEHTRSHAVEVDDPCQ